MFGQMMTFMLQMVMMKMVFNDLPHALGVVEPLSVVAEEGEFKIKAQRLTQGYAEPHSVEDGLLQSMGEELTAESNYEKRASHAELNGDPETAKLYRHVGEEENQHYMEFGLRLKELQRGQVSETRAIIY